LNHSINPWLWLDYSLDQLPTFSEHSERSRGKEKPRRTFGFATRSGGRNTIKSKPSSALDQVNDHDDEGNHEQEMDETAANVADEAEKPEHDEDDNYSPEHGVPFD